MDTFNVPLLAESSSSSSIANYAASNNNDSNNHHHHTPMLPFINYAQLQKDALPNSNSNPPIENFSSLQAIDNSQLDGAVSLSGLCERIFASPNPHSNSNHNNNNNNNVDVKGSAPSSGGNGPLILESVSMSSFANILFNNNRSNNNNNNNSSQNTGSVETLSSIDPLLLQKTSSVEYHQLKPLENGAGAGTTAAVVSTSGFLGSTTAQLLDFEVVPSSSDKDAIGIF
ncbi:uncharacterized protein Dvir_GJ26807 [Drosophila virilis]|uniref:Uncharacterized protein n=1 Tax=Drosophila virilis TaxID=7244 RepID=A0A0Q9WWY0_DROVI|nr:uncharacterized protein Dvir_GJ26807 [Drosophila virilis]